MQPSPAKDESSTGFEELGRASVHIVHDLKNQLNGLKLYATFLRKRLDRDDRPVDERETVVKLMAGLDRAAQDLTALTNYAKPIELRRHRPVDLRKILAQAMGDVDGSLISVEQNEPRLYGEFDPVALAAAIKTLIEQASIQKGTSLSFSVSRDDANEAVAEWRYVGAAKNDPFSALKGIASVRSSLAVRTIEAHGGRFEHDATGLRIRLPLI
jgi:signal transduction histidine kinase